MAKNVKVDTAYKIPSSNRSNYSIDITHKAKDTHSKRSQCQKGHS